VLLSAVDLEPTFVAALASHRAVRRRSGRSSRCRPFAWFVLLSSAALPPLSASSTARIHRPGSGQLAQPQRRRHRLYRPGFHPEHLDRIGQWSARVELLNAWRFDRPLKSKVFIEHWRIGYDLKLPLTAHGQLTTADFAKASAD